jgi:PTH2 family peptidyl-tRNA hydrolase
MAERPPPSAAAIAIGTAIISGLMGYYIGQAQSIGVFGNTKPSTATASNASRAKDEDESEDEGESEEDDDDGDDEEMSLEGLKSFESSTEECKMVFVVRTDLGMTKGEH